MKPLSYPDVSATANYLEEELTMRKTLAMIATLGLALAAMLIGPAASHTGAADHLDAPTVKKDGRIDINDVYVFHPGAPGSQDLSRTVLAMTVSPAAGALSPTDFHPDAKYQFLIDTDGDAVQDQTIVVNFSEVDDGEQQVVARLQMGDDVTRLARGMTGEVIEGDDVKLFAGLRDDPFFFDLASFNDGATFCEPGDVDFFLGLNTLAIVLEVPTELIGSGPVGVWARTRADVTPDNNRTRLVQADRMGRPAILTVFIPPTPFEPGPDEVGNAEDQFNSTQPRADQRRWRGEIVDTLQLLFSLNDASGDDPSDDAAQIQGLADVLLPDILTVDLSAETGFLNGRNLADDVIDAELGLITEGLITTDCIDNDSTFLDAFPYLGEPNTTP
jgi:hypothetical protein